MIQNNVLDIFGRTKYTIVNILCSPWWKIKVIYAYIYAYIFINSFWKDTEKWVMCSLTGRDLGDWRSEEAERQILFLALKTTFSGMYSLQLSFDQSLHSIYLFPIILLLTCLWLHIYTVFLINMVVGSCFLVESFNPHFRCLDINILWDYWFKFRSKSTSLFVFCFIFFPLCLSSFILAFFGLSIFYRNPSSSLYRLLVINPCSIMCGVCLRVCMWQIPWPVHLYIFNLHFIR